jgi:serine/threonine protein kinase
VTAPQLPPGHVIAGKYTVRAPLGYGGAMATYAAVSPPGREVVVKMYSPQLGQRREVIAALQHAAAVTNALPADATAPILESAFDPQNGAFFTVTDLVPLPSLLAQAAQGGPLPPAEVVSLLQGIARAVDAALAQRLVHGALKPRNVFVGPGPSRAVRVVDFGVGAARAALPTNEGWSIAAPWLAPEQVQGAAPMPASDVFSAALVAFYAATGKAYWRSCQGAALDLGGWQQEIAAPRVAASARARELGVSLSPALDVALGRALAPTPGERFGSVSELAAALAQQAAPRMAMTMPLNAAPQAALEAMRLGPPAASQAPPPQQSAGGDTLAIASPLEAMQWQPSAQPLQAPPPQPQPAPSAIKQPMGPQPMQQPMGPAPIQQPMGPPPMQQGFQPGPQGPAYAQPQQSFGPPPQSAVVLPKSNTGLIIGLVFAGVFVIGGAAGAVFYLRTSRVDATVAVPVQTATAAANTGSPTPPLPASTATTENTTSAPPVETQDAGPSEAADASAAAATAAVDAGGNAQEPAEVTIACVPDCETAKIDDKPLGVTDAGVVSADPIDLPPGAHTISVGKATYLTQTKRVVLKPGQKDSETFRLVKAGAVPVSKPCGKFLERCPN